MYVSAAENRQKPWFTGEKLINLIFREPLLRSKSGSGSVFWKSTKSRKLFVPFFEKSGDQKQISPSHENQF